MSKAAIDARSTSQLFTSSGIRDWRVEAMLDSRAGVVSVPKVESRTKLARELAEAGVPISMDGERTGRREGPAPWSPPDGDNWDGWRMISLSREPCPPVCSSPSHGELRHQGEGS